MGGKPSKGTPADKRLKENRTAPKSSSKSSSSGTTGNSVAGKRVK